MTSDPQGPWAVGYISAPSPVAPTSWTRWQAQVEAHALRLRLPLLHAYSAPSVGGASTATQVDGLAGMLSVVRLMAHSRSSHVSAVVVPSLEHLSPARDGSEQIVAMLLGLHLGVTVHPVEYLEPSWSGSGFSGPIHPTQSREDVLLSREANAEWPRGAADAGRSNPWTRPERVRAGLAFGYLLRGIHGDPDRAPIWVPSRTSEGPC